MPTSLNEPIVCPLDLAIRVIGGKWKMLVMRSMFITGAQRYNRLLETVPGISPKELTRNLRELENAGLIVRRTEHDNAASFEGYTLSNLGAALRPAFEALGTFGKLLL